MAFYSENGTHVAKRPRVEFHQPGAVAVSTLPPVMSPQYIEQQLNKKPLEPEKPNHILLFTIFNPSYPITCEVLHTICSPIGKVMRIVIFRKNGVQAMVEFENLDCAKIAKDALHGCDIYSGCCTLKIEYAKPSKLNVYKNDSDSYDYTNPNLGRQQNIDDGQPPSGPQRPVLLKEPLVPREQVNGGRNTNGLENGLPPSGPVAAQTPINAVQARVQVPAPGSYRTNGSAVGSSILTTPGTTLNAGTASTVTSTQAFSNQGSVCMVYGLNQDKMNATKLFNLFCLYGNVSRVKFLKTKEGCAMIQMGDTASVERVITNLNNSVFFGSRMQLGFSKQAFLADVQSPYQLPDGTPSFQDFMGSKNNRFMNPEMASKNRIQPPTKLLHFFNTPPGLQDHEVDALFVDQGAPRPKCVKMFPSKTERSSSGLIEFQTINEAIEALVVCNHLPVNNPNGKFPYIMKLCFSSSRTIPATIRQQ